MRIHANFFGILSICFFLFPRTYLAQSANEVQDDTVYMLTYDHGGLILWGNDHFKERMNNAVEWLDAYPGFKIGLENEKNK